MTRMNQQRSHQLIDLGSATVLTKGNTNNGAQDELNTMRKSTPGLTAK